MNKTYTESFQVRATDCDFEHRMRLDALFIAMQEGGEHHALSLGAGYDQMMARGLVLRPARIHGQARSARRGRTRLLSTRHGRRNEPLLLPSLPCLYLGRTARRWPPPARYG